MITCMILKIFSQKDKNSGAIPIINWHKNVLMSPLVKFFITKSESCHPSSIHPYFEKNLIYDLEDFNKKQTILNPKGE